MLNKARTVLICIAVLSFLSAYNNTSTKTVTSDKFACNELAALDKKCEGVGAVVSAPPQVHNEMNDLSKSYWSQYLCKKNDSFYIVVKHLGKLLYELKEVRFSGNTYELTPADRLNSIDRKGSLSAAALAYRYRAYGSNDKWSDWIDYGPGLNVSVEMINGQWQVEKQDKVESADCSNLPQ